MRQAEAKRRVPMASFIQLLVSGLATGAIYALIAVGFTLLWQTSQTINFAQGEFVMLPAFFILAAMNLGRAVLAGGADRYRAVDRHSRACCSSSSSSIRCSSTACCRW